MNINKIPKNIRVLVPFWLKRILVRFFVKIILIGSPGKFDKPRISFAGILPPEGAFIRGGKVKLTHLRKRFGEYKKNFNILYLVSSTLPGFSDIWVDEAKRKGVKVVWNQNGIGCPAWSPIWKKINNSMKPLAKADYVVYQSNFSQTESEDMVAKADCPTTVITNCCDTTIFKPAEPSLSSTPLRLLIMGTHMTPEKILVPLKALRILLNKGLDVNIRIYGPAEWPNAEVDINNTIKELDLENRVLRRGKYLQNEAPDLYREGHIYIHLKHMDSSPTAILEAIASGLPVIGSKSGGVAEWISPEAGITLEVPISREKLFYPSPEKVAEAVEIISKDLAKYSIGARRHAVKFFDDKDWIKAHEVVFNKILKNEKKSTN
ncbi:MAG: glycosyltransferase family 4 protein [Minisyncoccia bacterium]